MPPSDAGPGVAGPSGAAESIPSSPVPRLEAIRLAARRAGRQVLADFSFAVAPGEVFGILGPNGAGKTTAFQVLAGLVPPSAGELRLDGVPVRPGDRRLRARTGVVFQQPSLDTRLSARQNLGLGAALYRVPRAVARERAARLLDLAGLSERADEPVARYSGGMRRRLEICRALVHDPEILILDEPTTGLDQRAFQLTWQQLFDLRDRRGLTILVTTHRPEEGEFCDRIALLDGGRAIACDTPARLKSQVSGDVLVVEADEPGEVAARIRESFGLDTRVVDGRVVLERHRGHELIPRLVEALPPGRLRAVSLHPPSLADVFLHLTGRALGDGRGVPS
jgi:ABC-2 type transport system ATP-binding protein